MNKPNKLQKLEQELLMKEQRVAFWEKNQKLLVASELFDYRGDDCC